MGNVFGTLFRVTTFGESHGPAVGCVVDCCPPKIALSEKDIQKELDRRKPGQSELTTSRNEQDKVKILSGVFEGQTLGTPIAMIVENADAKSKDYEKLADVFRPGHADFTWQEKYGIRDYRGGGRASGRETIGRVMAGAIAKKILAHYLPKLVISAYAKQIGGTTNPKEFEKTILKAKEDGDSVGGIVEITVKNMISGLGEPVFDKLGADLGKALLSIPAIKGIEFGSGFSAAEKFGSEQNDSLVVKNGKISFTKNDAGGLLGGISTGEDLVIRIAVKPTSSISKEQLTVTKGKKPVKIEIHGRHDPCIVPRIIPVAESMVAIVLLDHLMRARMTNSQLPTNYQLPIPNDQKNK
jgi:chorismate synthase